MVRSLLSFLILLSLALSPFSAWAGEGFGLKIGTLSPEGTALTKALRQASDEIKDKTEGRAYLKLYTGGVMGGDPVMLRKMRVGQLHGAFLTPGGLSKYCPDYSILSMPQIVGDYAEADAARASVENRIMGKLEKMGVAGTGIVEIGFVYLMSNQVIAGAEDVKKTKPWNPEGNGLGQEIFESFGVTPVNLPVPDVLTALQTGIIDTVFSSPVAAVALQWFTKVKYVTDAPLLYSYGTLAFDAKALKKLSEQDRKIVLKVVSARMKEVDGQSRTANASARAALKKNGIEFVAVDAASLDELRKVTEPLIAKRRDQGLFDKDILKDVRLAVEKVRSGQ